MLAKVISAALSGIDACRVDVEIDISSGLPAFDLVGLPDSAVKESKERVRTAIKNTSLSFPSKRITVNLAPANIKKEGPAYDLPIAAGILACMNVVPFSALHSILFAGELSLDGSIRPVSGILPMVYSAYENGIKSCILPDGNKYEAALVKGISIYPVKTLSELIGHLNGRNPISPFEAENTIFSEQTTNTHLLDFSEVKGQEAVKRALEIAAAGMHNLLMTGPPGSGKTMLAKRLPSILPDLTFEESIEITKIYSVAGFLKDKSSLIKSRPFRSPHHTISSSALIGGGRIPKPGEISLAHNGVLFLDELPEFQRNVLEVMRQPLEDRVVTISRVNGTMSYPANFMLIAAMNPCPCGYFGDDNRCDCSYSAIMKYNNRLSGPLLDRIDIFIDTPAVAYQDLQSKRPQEASAAIKKRVVKAHEMQLKRYQNTGILFNSQLSAAQIEQYCELGKKEKNMVQKAFEQFQLSARSYHKILKLARTVADLSGSEMITEKHLMEVMQYRYHDPRDRF